MDSRGRFRRGWNFYLENVLQWIALRYDNRSDFAASFVASEGFGTTCSARSRWFAKGIRCNVVRSN